MYISHSLPHLSPQNMLKMPYEHGDSSSLLSLMISICKGICKITITPQTDNTDPSTMVDHEVPSKPSHTLEMHPIPIPKDG